MQKLLIKMYIFVFVIIGMVFASGCVNTNTNPIYPDIKAATRESYKKLVNKAVILAERYAVNENESAESIGYAVLSECAKEILEVVGKGVNGLRPQLHGSNRIRLIQKFRQEREVALRQKLWEMVISIVVKNRNEAFLGQQE